METVTREEPMEMAHQNFGEAKKKCSRNRGCQNCEQPHSNLRECVPYDLQSNALTTKPRIQLPSRQKIFAIYLIPYHCILHLALPDPNECHSTLMSATRREMLTSNRNKYNSALMSVTGGFPLSLYYNGWNYSPVQNLIL